MATPPNQNSNSGHHNLIVNYLPHNFYEDDLTKLFSVVATPTYVKIIKNNLGVSKGFGFVNFATKQEAIACRQKFNKYQITERKQLKVSWSRPGDRVGCNLHVKHIPREWNEEDLKTLFDPFGEIIDVRVLRFPNSTYNKESGFVRFNDPSAAREAANRLNGFRPFGHRECCIQIEIAHKDMKKIETRYNRNIWRESHFKSKSNSIIARLMGLYGQRKDIELNIDMELRQSENQGPYLVDVNKRLDQLDFARQRITQEMKIQMRALFDADRSSAEMMSRVDNQCALWLNEFAASRFPRFSRSNSDHKNCGSFSPADNGYRGNQSSVLSNHKFPRYAATSTPPCLYESKVEIPNISPLPMSSNSSGINGNCVYFTNFPPEFPAEVIKSTFEMYSKVEQLKLEHDNNGKRLGMGFAIFGTAAETERVQLSLDGAIFLGRKITIRKMSA